MPVWGIVTAERYATGLASAQVQPPAMYFYAFFAYILLSGFDLRDRAQVLAYMTIHAKGNKGVTEQKGSEK